LLKIQHAKIKPKSPSAHHHTTLLGCIFATKAVGKNLLNGSISSICPHNMVIIGPLTVRSVQEFGAPQLISTVFASWLHYCTDIAQRTSTLHDVWPSPALVYCINIVGGLMSPDRILPAAKFTLHRSLPFTCPCSAVTRTPRAVDRDVHCHRCSEFQSEPRSGKVSPPTKQLFHNNS